MLRMRHGHDLDRFEIDRADNDVLAPLLRVRRRRLEVPAPATLDMADGNAAWSPFIPAEDVPCGLGRDRERPARHENVKDPVVTILQREIVIVAGPITVWAICRFRPAPTAIAKDAATDKPDVRP
jgi:hypothetical protein